MASSHARIYLLDYSEMYAGDRYEEEPRHRNLRPWSQLSTPGVQLAFRPWPPLCRALS